MKPKELTQILESEYAAFMAGLRQEVDLSRVERVFRALATTPAPTGNIAELLPVVKGIIKDEFGWASEKYKVIMNKKDQVVVVFGNLSNDETFISIVPHGDQIMFNPSQHGWGFPEGIDGRRDGFNYVQLTPSHKYHLKPGDEYYGACYLYHPTKNSTPRITVPEVGGGYCPGLELLTKGKIRCLYNQDISLKPLSNSELASFREGVRNVFGTNHPILSSTDHIEIQTFRKHMRDVLGMAHPAIREGDVSQIVFEYPQRVGRIPPGAVIIYDNDDNGGDDTKEGYYNAMERPTVRAACADDRAGVCSALFASDIIFKTIVMMGKKVVVNIHADEEGPSDRGEHWSDDAIYGIHRALKHGKKPADTAIIIDGHRVGGNTQLGKGAFYCLRPGAGYGSRTPQGTAAYLDLITVVSQEESIMFGHNPEYVSRSSDVHLKFWQTIINIGYSIDHPHIMPESVNLRDLGAVAKSVALIAITHSIRDLGEQYLNKRADEFRY